MNILLCFNSHFCDLARVLIISLMCHHKELHFYVGYLNLLEEEMLALKDLVSAPGPWDEGRDELPKRDITFLYFSEDDIKILPLEAGWTYDTWLRCFLWERIAAERVLYLDSDIIVNKDLSPLYNLDFGEDLIVASPDLGMSEKEQERLGLPCDPSYPYVNAGVVLFNLKGMREAGMSAASCLQGALDVREKLRWNDQDFINIFFFNKIKYVDPYVYNCNVIVLSDNAISKLPHYNDIHFAEGQYTSSLQNDELIEDNMAIIHYTGRKPITVGYRRLGADRFWYYALMDKTNLWRFQIIHFLQRCFRFIKRMGL